MLAPIALVAPTASAQEGDALFGELITDCPLGDGFGPILRFSDGVIYCAVRIAALPCPDGLANLTDIDGSVFCLGRVADFQPIQPGQVVPEFYTATDCDGYMLDNFLAGAAVGGKCYSVLPDGTFVNTPIVGSTGSTCAGNVVTVDLGAGSLPTDGDDVILGTSGPDVIAGGAGNDIICGGGGDDVIWGQAGVDFILGEDGDDKIRGGDDTDVLSGGEGADDISGGRGDDWVFGEGGDDRKIRGGTGDDLIGGDKGNDLLVAGQGGQDSVYGGDGDDQLVTGGPRPDMIFTGSGDDLAKGHKGADQIFGSYGDDDLRGGEQSDRIDGGWGDDTCNGGLQVDTAVECETLIGVENSTPATLPRSARQSSDQFATNAVDHARIHVNTQDLLNR